MSTQITQEHKERLLRIAKIIDAGDMALAEEIFNLENQIALVVKALNDGLQYAVKLAETTQRLPGPKGETGVRGLPGDNYVLQEKDRLEIAKHVKVPVVEKVIEVQTIVKEQPIIQEKIIEVKEIVVQETIDEINRLKGEIELLKQRLTKKGTFTGSGSRPIRVFNNGTEVSQNVLELNFVNASALTSTGTVGRRVNITTGGGTFTGSQEKSTTTPNGVVTTFSFTHTPTLIHWNGAFQTLTDDYTVSGLTITFTSSAGVPLTNDKIINVY